MTDEWFIHGLLSSTQLSDLRCSQIKMLIRSRWRLIYARKYNNVCVCWCLPPKSCLLPVNINEVFSKMLVNYHVPDFLFSYCTVASVTMVDVKYSGENLPPPPQKKLINLLVLGHDLIGSLCVWINNFFLETWGVSTCVWLTSSPAHGFLVQRSCARPHRCWAWTHLCPAGCASTRQQTHSEHVNTQIIKSWIIHKTNEEPVKGGMNRRRLSLPPAFHWRDELADRWVGFRASVASGKQHHKPCAIHYS